jgi:hypothetical protein
VIEEFRNLIDALPALSRGMLAHYRAAGQAEPVDAHVAAGGVPNQPIAYGRNRPLRRAGLIEHVERETYRYALPDRVAEQFDGHRETADVAGVTRAVERAFVDPASADDTARGETEATADGGDDETARDVPTEERGDVEVVTEDERVSPDDGFVAEDAAIIDDGDDESGGGGESTEQGDEEGGDDGGTTPVESDTGGVEIL